MARCPGVVNRGAISRAGISPGRWKPRAVICKRTPWTQLCILVSILVCSVVASIAQAALAATQPRLAITREVWKSSTGACTVDLRHATVMGVSAEEKTRIDGVLAALLASRSPSAAVAPRQREATCAKAIAHRGAGAAADSYSSDESADWTTGLAHGRWLSVRVHVSAYSSGAVHPSDAYAAVTFDLAHGGYPVPTSGFYTHARRPMLERVLAKAELAHLAAEQPGEPLDAAKIAYVRNDIAMSAFTESDFLLTTTGIEVTGIITTDAEGKQMIAVPYASLRGIGTPGGPLDPTTR